MTSRLPALAALLLLAGCTAAPPPRPMAPAVPADDNLNAVAWIQGSVEHDLIYLQTYRDAQRRLPAALADRRWDALTPDDRVAPARRLPPAVVLDVDETVLDNSPYQARLIRAHAPFNQASWDAWCREGRARALPGVVEFTRYAAAHGVKVIYISNRDKALDEATLANLRQVGVPVSGPEALLGLGTKVPGCTQHGSDKGCRRQQVSRHYRVLMQFGDQLGDFLDISQNTPAGREAAVKPYLEWIGRRWFVLPNPSYGSWEPALFGNQWAAPMQDRRLRKIESLRIE
ncbi:5'-nucleotidase, lipoprotein e(P4) family [Frateuria sp. STR12]|uniref:5'-nucleotidase, lipoprotein e(P4) family n=1 Tax=Frateuria hangzhouensis TaxID=2995589 RepID=UPI002260CA36|nr:5'-nucleotidase, lipoprotein e(P4) family [Frateuria sp. STR12]MCX7512652.1 5'-nucleotidase, lipoprotein e(P4) family [Frateuria sp. STR12]